VPFFIYSYLSQTEYYLNPEFMKHFFCTFIIIVLSFSANAQPLSAYTNFQNQFMVWDNGIIRKIEYLVPTKVEIGRFAIPYIDNSRNFKVYYNGGSQQINSGFTSSFQASDYLVTYQNAKALNVWENGKVTNLAGIANNFFLGDSLVVFFDGMRSEYKAYYNGEIYPIENFLAGTSADLVFNTETKKSIFDNQDIASGQLPSVKVSDNIAAYVNYANQFHMFYLGQIIEQEPYLINSFDVGRNIVAYVDINRQFKVFHSGNTRMLEEFPPYEYAAGDNVVAFVANDNYFKIFYGDSVYTIGYFQPEFQVKDNIVAYKDASGYFNVFYKGKIYTLESYYPEDYIAAYNSVAYVNRANVLRLFSEGEIYDVTNAEIAAWQLNYDVVQYRFGGNMYKIFYKGRTY